MTGVVSRGVITSLGAPQTRLPSGWAVEIERGETVSLNDVRELGHGDPLRMWGQQPSVRKVVDFIARQIASTPLKVYRRVSDTDRQRVTDHPLARVLSRPAPGLTPFRFAHSLIVDWLLFDRWCAAKVKTSDADRPLTLTRLQAARVRFADDGLANVSGVWVDGKLRLDPAGCLLDHGYAPIEANGITPMQTLWAILAESREAVEYRRSVWRNAGRVPAVIQRPADAPEWSDTARDRFLSGWRAYTRGGGSEGGTPILQDGMTLAAAEAFKPRDTADIEGRQLNDAEVASAYHIAPELVGAREGNYSNMAAFREALYGDALGPYYEPLQQVFNAMLVPDLDPTGELYVEFDIETKMRGSFATQAQVLSTSVGRPWMLAAEARARMNLPDLGGDTHDLVTPLNVLIGGQASPRDSGSQNTGKAAGPLTKARAADTYQVKAEQILTGFYERQAVEVLKAMGQKAASDWWDADRWDTELAGDLYQLAMLVSTEIGKRTAETLGFHADDYDIARTEAFLHAVAESHAEAINQATLDQVNAALAAEAPVSGVFDNAKAQRAIAGAATLITAYSAFATTEAARQLGGSTATKTWITGSNPRPSHAAMNGETVDIDARFSNGMDWPGDLGDPDEVAGCNCDVQVNI